MSTQGYRDAGFIPSDYRANFKQIIAKRPDLTQFAGGRLIPAPTSALVTTYAGTVLGIVTASGLYKPYVSSATDGSQIPVGVLAEDATTDMNGYGSEASIITSGQLFQSLLIGLDSNAISVLNAHSLTEHGDQILSF